jgi:hypothetical protein
MRRIKAVIVAFAAVIASPTAQAQHMREDSLAGAYAPRLGDLMITQQIRHAKLWFSVAANNWELAEHGLHELKRGFADVAQHYPTLYGVTVAPVVGALNDRELAELARAIEARDRVKFTVAFDLLTAACNACHQVTKHGFIVIQQPISPPFNNQSFALPGGQSPPTTVQQHPH